MTTNIVTTALDPWKKAWDKITPEMREHYGKEWLDQYVSSTIIIPTFSNFSPGHE